MLKIIIESGSLAFEAELTDTAKSQSVYEALPITAAANTWGKEIYFSIPVQADLDANATDQLPVGSIAYWPPSNAFYIIWGPTPARHRDEPRFASLVNNLGKISSDLSELNQINDGDEIRIAKG